MGPTIATDRTYRADILTRWNTMEQNGTLFRVFRVPFYVFLLSNFPGSSLLGRVRRVDEWNMATPAAAPPPVPQNTPPAGALSAQQLKQLHDASQAHRGLRRAARTAFSSAATTLVIGTASALCTLFSVSW